MRRAAKRDASEKLIVEALRKGGASVYLMDKPCDILCGFAGKTALIEAKTPKTSYGKKLNANQADFNATWRGSPIIIIRTSDEALEWLNSQRKAAA